MVWCKGICETGKGAGPRAYCSQLVTKPEPYHLFSADFQRHQQEGNIQFEAKAPKATASALWQTRLPWLRTNTYQRLITSQKNHTVQKACGPLRPQHPFCARLGCCASRLTHSIHKGSKWFERPEAHKVLKEELEPYKITGNRPIRIWLNRRCPPKSHNTCKSENYIEIRAPSSPGTKRQSHKAPLPQGKSWQTSQQIPNPWSTLQSTWGIQEVMGQTSDTCLWQNCQPLGFCGKEVLRYLPGMRLKTYLCHFSMKGGVNKKVQNHATRAFNYPPISK